MRRFPILAALLAAASLSAQAPSSQSAAVGSVFDSIRLRPLAGARVRLDSSGLFTITDANGRFRLEGIAPGPHYLRVEHPLADTLGLSLRTKVATFAAGETKITEIATPSQESMVAVSCSSVWRARGPTMLTGRIREADTGAPAVGAKVSLVWYEIATVGGLRKTPRVREATVAADGIYRICGLPAELEGKAQVMRGGVTSGDVSIAFGQDLVLLRSLSIAQAGTITTEATLPEVDSAGKEVAKAPPPRVYGSARLTGRVVNKANLPIEGAHVQLDGANRATLTRRNGEFTMDSLPSGTQTVSARKLGYTVTEAAVDLSSSNATSVTISMGDFTPVLETVRVTAQRESALDAVGYSGRKRASGGWFMDGQEVTTRTMSKFSDVLRSAPGIQISRSGGDKQFITDSRDPVNGCVNIWIDGTQWQQLEPGDVDDFLRPGDVQAVEVYSNTTTPAQFEGIARGSCRTVVVWTARRLDRDKNKKP